MLLQVHDELVSRRRRRKVPATIVLVRPGDGAGGFAGGRAQRALGRLKRARRRNWMRRISARAFRARSVGNDLVAFTRFQRRALETVEPAGNGPSGRSAMVIFFASELRCVNIPAVTKPNMHRLRLRQLFRGRPNGRN